MLDHSPETADVFDLVLFLGVLYHMRHPLQALERVYSVTGKQLILETHLDMLDFDRPAMAFYPGDELNGDPSSWRGPNVAAVALMLECWVQPRSTALEEVIHTFRRRIASIQIGKDRRVWREAGACRFPRLAVGVSDAARLRRRPRFAPSMGQLDSVERPLPQIWTAALRIDEGPGWVELRPSTIKPLAFGLDSRRTPNPGRSMSLVEFSGKRPLARRPAPGVPPPSRRRRITPASRRPAQVEPR